jgi:hypothetical protein
LLADEIAPAFIAEIDLVFVDDHDSHPFPLFPAAGADLGFDLCFELSEKQGSGYRFSRLSAGHTGNAEAQNNLGMLYAEGKGVPKDYVQARQWYEKAAAQGHALAQNNLAELYFAGLGVQQDYVRAYMWVSLAAVHLKGDEQKQAEANRDDVAQRMTPGQVTEAKRLSKECLSKKFKGC